MNALNFIILYSGMKGIEPLTYDFEDHFSTIEVQSLFKNLRVVRIELTVSAWKANRLPLTDTRDLN